MGAHQDQMRGFARYNREFNLLLFSKVADLDDSEHRRNMGGFEGR